MARKLQAQTHMGSYGGIDAKASSHLQLKTQSGRCARKRSRSLWPLRPLAACRPRRPCPAKPLRWPSVPARRAATAAAQRCPEAASPQCRTCSSCHARCAARGWASCWLSCRPGPRACSTPGGPGGREILILSSCTEQNPALVWPAPGAARPTSKLLQTNATPLHSACTSYKTPCLCPDGPGALIALTAPLLADQLDLKH